MVCLLLVKPFALEGLPSQAQYILPHSESFVKYEFTISSSLRFPPEPLFAARIQAHLEPDAVPQAQEGIISQTENLVKFTH